MTKSVTRREFLHASALAAAALKFAPDAVAQDAVARNGFSIDDTIVINALGAIYNANLMLVEPPEGAPVGPTGEPMIDMLDDRALDDAIASGMTAVNETIGYVAGPMEPFEYSVGEVARYHDTLRRHSDRLLHVLTAADIRRAKDAGKVGMILGFQNAAMMGDNAERVDVFAKLGVRIIQLTYNGRNQLGDGSMEPENRGLTDFGLEVLQRLHDNKVLVDLSHSGERTCLDAIRHSTRPIAITHSGCRALSDLPRNKTDEELRLLADKGGVVGIYFMPFLRPKAQAYAADLVAHIEHAIDVCGEDHVGIGTDGGTTAIDDFPAFKARIQKQVEHRKAAGISATGEDNDIVPMLPDLQGPQQFQDLADMLHARGHSAARIEKILGDNFLRLFEEVWGA